MILFCNKDGENLRNRSVAFVIRNGKILVEKLCYFGRTFYSIPGGGIEDGETPEQAVIRELKEECGLSCRYGNKGIILGEDHGSGRFCKRSKGSAACSVRFR